MEQYQMETLRGIPIKQGEFFDRIHKKHIEAYGVTGASNIVQNVRAIYQKLMGQLASFKNPNSLLVGKVQSGKTSNLELLTAFAFDNGYNLLVIYGGYDRDLLRQCTERFSETFDAASEKDLSDSDMPVVFTTNIITSLSNPLACLSIDFARDLLEEKRPIIITCLKRPEALRKTNRILNDLMCSIPGIKPFIIDDEGDQASLNTAKDKVKDGTATYNCICSMKKTLKNPLYLSVTATPQANIFQEDISELIPCSIHLIQPGDGYDGASVYHLSENDIICPVKDNEDDVFPDSLRDAFYYFIIVSTIKSLLNDSKKAKKSDMIIHSDRTVSSHGQVYSKVYSIFQLIRSAFDNKNNNQEEYHFYLKYLKGCYDRYLADDQKYSNPFNETFVDEIGLVLRRMGIILQNGKGKETKESEKTKLHKVFIGGDLLQRGLTFPNLLVSYFTRFAKNGGNMDTTLQRARWFGYRSKYLDLCKIFTTDEIAKEFSVLAEVEDDLWEQFDDVENGILAINDIIITAEDTKQSPTAKNKAKFKKVRFKNRWIKQKFIVVDNDEITENNKLVRDIVANISDWIPISDGSTNNQQTGLYSIFSSAQLKKLIQSIESSFDREPFNKKYLVDLIGSSEVPVILMGKGIEDVRYRSVHNDAFKDRIKALHQGANTTDESRLNYLGDKKVIVDPSKINIQIHYVSPGVTKDNRLGKDQFMFAIYLPKDKIYFVKDND